MPTDMRILISRGRDLREAAYAVRRQVFVEEQGVPSEEVFDELDEAALHVVGFTGEVPVATARCINEEGSTWRIGLVAVAKSVRGQGLGSRIMRAAIDAIVSFGGEEIVLSAQSTATDFYGQFGFEQCGEAAVFESGFVLVPMNLRLPGDD